MYRADFMERTSDGEAYSILTSRHHEDILLQKSGHCDLVETPEGEWYAVHLCGRASEDRNPADAPRFPGSRRYMLGRETAIQKMKWTEDEWLVMECGGNTPQLEVEMPKGVRGEPGPAEAPGERSGRTQTEAEAPKESGGEKASDAGDSAGKKQLVRDDFDEPELNLDYQSLRVPMDNYHISLTERPGYLRMYGRSGLASKFTQTLIARSEERRVGKEC